MTQHVAPAGRPARAEVRRFRPDIEGLRAVAVVLVVLGHSGLALTGGYVGVDVFFVISGFLITRQLAEELARRDRISFTRFYARRARRILPAATVVIVATLLASAKWLSPLRMPGVTGDGIFSAFSGINWRLAVQGTNYFNANAPPSPFQHYWSLGVEEQFYLLWPLLLLVAALLIGRRIGRTKATVWTLLAVLVGSLYLCATLTTTSVPWAYFGSHTRAWELAMGALLAITVSTWTRMPPALACQMSWLGLLMITVAAWQYTGATLYPGLAALLPVVGAGFVIAGGCPGWARGAELILRRRPMQFGGRMSYSWYLWHWPVLVIAPAALGHDLSAAQRLLAISASLGLAVVTFYTVEQPIRARSSLIARPVRGLSMGGGLIAASIAAAVIIGSTVIIPVGRPASASAAKSAGSSTEIARLVAAAATVKALPATSPALRDAPADGFHRTCLAPYADRTVKICRVFGDPNGTKTVVLLGDSHANQWLPAVDAFAKKAQWRLLEMAKAACPPGVYPSYVSLYFHRIYSECNAWRSSAFSEIKRIRPSVVIISSQMRPISVDPAGMVQTIRTIQSAGAHVLYLADTPYPNRLIPDCLAQHATDIRACGAPRHSPLTRLDGMVQRRLEIPAARTAGATVIDPTPWFCTDQVCPAVIDNKIVYRDNDHITATYATWLAPQLGEALTRATR